MFLQVISMGNITTYWGYLSMGVSLRRAITFSWETMWTEESSPWRQSVCCWLTKSNTQKTSFCWGETTSVLPSTEFMDSMMSVSWLCLHGLLSVFCLRHQVELNINIIRYILLYLNVFSTVLWCFVHFLIGKRRYNIKLWKTFTDCFNCLPIAAIVDEKIFCCHGGRFSIAVVFNLHVLDFSLLQHTWFKLMGSQVAEA